MTDLSTPVWVRWWFRGAALYGTALLLLVLLSPPPPIGMLYYYGFAGTALAFQLVFWIIGGDPVRHRPLMPAAVIEKLAFVVPTLLLLGKGEIGAIGVAAGIVDAVLGVGFAIAWRGTPRA